MTYEITLVLESINVWGSDVLAVPVTFSKQVILVWIALQRHVHPTHIFLVVLCGTIVEWSGNCVVPPLWGVWGLPVLAQQLHDWRVHTGMIHGLEADIIHEETILVSRRACCSYPAHVVIQIGSIGPETVLETLSDPGSEVIPDLVGRRSAIDRC